MTITFNPNALEPTRAGAQARSAQEAELQTAARQFESFFLSYVLKQMQASSLDSGLFGEGMGGDTYSELFTDELARVMSEGRGLGLADQLFRQLESRLGSTKTVPGGHEAQPAQPQSATAQPVANVRPRRVGAIPTSAVTPAEGVTKPAVEKIIDAVRPLEPRAGLTAGQIAAGLEPNTLMTSGVTALTPGAADALAATRSLPAKTTVEAVKPAALAPVGEVAAGERTAPDFDQPLETGAITSRYGVRRDPLTGQRRFHGGVDIAAQRGTAIRAAAEGRVIYAGQQGGYGNTVIIEHNNGYRTRYAHADTLAVRAGDVIEAGQEIGTVGSTGRSTGPHLHFEVTKNGRRLNPKEIFR